MPHNDLDVFHMKHSGLVERRETYSEAFARFLDADDPTGRRHGLTPDRAPAGRPGGEGGISEPDFEAYARVLRQSGPRPVPPPRPSLLGRLWRLLAPRATIYMFPIWIVMLIGMELVDMVMD
jgi:hypothetical protein